MWGRGSLFGIHAVPRSLPRSICRTVPTLDRSFHLLEEILVRGILVLSFVLPWITSPARVIPYESLARLPRYPLGSPKTQGLFRVDVRGVWLRFNIHTPGV